MSYNDFDIGYELGYDTETVITSRQIAPTQAQGESYAVVYRMDTTVAGLATDIYTRALAAFENDDEPIAGSGPVGSSSVPLSSEDLAAAGSDLAAMVGRRSSEETSAVGDTGDMAFTVEDSEHHASVMDGILGELTETPAFSTAESREMFRNQYTGMTDTALRAVVAREAGQSDEAWATRIHENMMTAFHDDVEAHVMGRFPEGGVSGADVTRLADEAIAQNIPEGTELAGGASRRAIYRTIDDGIPRGSHDLSDVPLHRAATDRAIGRLEEATLPVFRSVDRGYYTRRAEGAERAATDTRLMLEDRGIADDPAAIEDLMANPDALRTAVTDFHTRVGNGPTESGVLPTGRRAELMDAADMPLIDTSDLTTEAHRVTIAAEEIRSRGESERAESHEHHEVAMETVREGFRREEMSTEHNNRMTEGMMNQAMQMLGQLINTMVASTTRMLENQVQGLNQMANPRAPDPWTGFNAASGHGRGSTSSVN